MSNLRKRVESLERRWWKPRPTNLLEFQITAMEQWSQADLQLLIDACAAQTAGCALTEAESAVLKAYGSAMKKECTQAGFRSIAECERWYRTT
jgi:hypothetical protein